VTRTISLFELNPALDAAALARRFTRDRRISIRNFLTDESARTIHDVLSRGTEWGLAWHAAEDGPHNIPGPQLVALPPAQREAIGRKVTAAMRARDYGFVYGQYPMVHAYLEKWAPDGPHDLLVEHINSPPFMDFVRGVTGMAELIKADGQATLYAPQQFLAMHDDSHVAEGWRVAYVMSFCAEDWRPDWGGYLMFYDEDGDVVAGYRPRFNALNLFLVPQRHNVTYVPPYAPVGRFSVTGWFRDR